MSEDISSIKSLRAGSQGFALLMLFLCVILVLCLCELRVRILCVDGRSRYLYIVLGGYLLIYWCTQCSILLHLIDICFLPCIFLWQISHIQTGLCVVLGPVFVSTSPAFMCSSASCPAGPHIRLAQKRYIEPPLLGGGGGERFPHNFHSSLWPPWQLHRLYRLLFGAMTLASGEGGVRYSRL